MASDYTRRIIFLRRKGIDYSNLTTRETFALAEREGYTDTAGLREGSATSQIVSDPSGTAQIKSSTSPVVDGQPAPASSADNGAVFTSGDALKSTNNIKPKILPSINDPNGIYYELTPEGTLKDFSGREFTIEKTNERPVRYLDAPLPYPLRRPDRRTTTQKAEDYLIRQKDIGEQTAIKTSGAIRITAEGIVAGSELARRGLNFGVGVYEGVAGSASFAYDIFKAPFSPIKTGKTIKSTVINFGFDLVERGPVKIASSGIGTIREATFKNPERVFGNIVGAELSGRIVGKGIKTGRNLYFAATREYVPPEKVFSLQVLKEGKTFPTRESPSQALSLFRERGTVTGGRVVVSSASPKPLSGTVVSGGPAGKLNLEDYGLYVTPRGEGSPYFTGVMGEEKTYGFSILPKISRPTVSEVTTFGVERLPKNLRNIQTNTEGYAAVNKYLISQAKTGKAFITRGSEIGGRTLELEAIVPFSTFLEKQPAKRYTKLKGYAVPIQEYKTISFVEQPTKQIKTTITTKSVYTSDYESMRQLSKKQYSLFDVGTQIKTMPSNKFLSSSEYKIFNNKNIYGLKQSSKYRQKTLSTSRYSSMGSRSSSGRPIASTSMYRKTQRSPTNKSEISFIKLREEKQIRTPYTRTTEMSTYQIPTRYKYPSVIMPKFPSPQKKKTFGNDLNFNPAIKPTKLKPKKYSSKYTPSVVANYFNIKSKQKPKDLFGLETRPIVG